MFEALFLEKKRFFLGIQIFWLQRPTGEGNRGLLNQLEMHIFIGFRKFSSISHCKLQWEVEKMQPEFSKSQFYHKQNNLL